MHGVPLEGGEPAGSTEGPSASDHEVHLPGGRDLPARSGSLKATVSNEPPKAINSPGITISDYALRAESALVAAKVTRKDAKLNLLRVVAPAAGGINPLGRGLRHPDRYESLPGYATKFAELLNQANEKVERFCTSRPCQKWDIPMAPLSSGAVRDYSQYQRVRWCG